MEIPRKITFSRCCHGHMSPSLFKSGKCISKQKLYDLQKFLQSKHGNNNACIESVPVSNLLCSECFESEKVSKQLFCERIAKITNLLNHLKCSSSNDSETSFIVSKKFQSAIKCYLSKLTKSNNENMCTFEENVDQTVNSSITCKYCVI